MSSDWPLRLFIHGGGRRGRDAWPEVSTDDAVFVSFKISSTISEQVDAIREICADRRITLFAHSIGAVPAVLAARTLRSPSLVLIEPALYDIARGNTAIERHISAVTEARAQSAVGNLRGFWAILRPLMFGGPLDDERWETERPVAERWSVTNLPWGHGVRPEVLEGIRTLVVTGAWNDEYEAIAKLLEERGAEHVVLTGAAHRAQDLPAFRDITRKFEAASD